MRHFSIALLLLGLAALSCKGPEGPTGPPGPDNQSLVDPAIKPRVIYSYPSDGSQGPYTDFNNRVVVRFNKYMDRTAIQHATRITSPLGDVQLDSTTVSASNTDAFSFGPLDIRGTAFKFHWRIGESYTLSIDTTARDVNGNMLVPPYVMSLVPEPVFRVVSTSPANGATDIGLTTRLTVTFNSQVDSSIFRSVRLTPPAQGSWGYIGAYPAPDSTVIAFFPKTYLLDTLYTISVDSSAHDKYGNRMGVPFASSFTTAAFHVSGTSPTDGTLNVSLVPSIVVSFTAGIDTGSVRTAFSIVSSVEGDFHLSNGASSFSFVPKGHLRTNTQYTVTISTALRSRTGAVLEQPYSFSFITLPFQGVGSQPLDGGSNIPLYEQLFMLFSDYIDTGTVRSSFSISPQVNGFFVLTDSSQSFYFVPSGDLAPGTTYTMTVMTSLRSMAGDSLWAPFTVSFTTAPFGIISTNPAGGSIGVSRTTAIQIGTNAALDTSTIRNAFSISPAAPGQIVPGPSSRFTFYPTGQLLADTTYNVQISTALRTKEGVSLGSNYTFSFTTGP